MANMQISCKDDCTLIMKDGEKKQVMVYLKVLLNHFGEGKIPYNISKDGKFHS
jgi:hypothetical protein